MTASRRASGFAARTLLQHRFPSTGRTSSFSLFNASSSQRSIAKARAGAGERGNHRSPIGHASLANASRVVTTHYGDMISSDCEVFESAVQLMLLLIVPR
jgi:hypothetical protein